MAFNLLTGLFSFPGKVRRKPDDSGLFLEIVEYCTVKPIWDALPPCCKLIDEDIDIFLEEISLGLNEQYNPDFLKTTWEVE